LSFDQRTQGNFALAAQPQGYAELKSLPMPSIGPVDDVISFDLNRPDVPMTHGAVQLFVSIPSLGLYNVYLGQIDLLQQVAPKQWTKLNFALWPELKAALDAQYSDLELKIAMNVPYDFEDIILVDNWQVGPLTVEPAPLPVNTPLVRDFVSVARAGSVQVTFDGDTDQPAFELGAFYVEAADRDCIPSESTACRVIIHMIRLGVGGFELKGENIGRSTFINETPFEVVLGGAGASSLSSPIPGNVQFTLRGPLGGSPLLIPIRPGNNASVSFTPAGGGAFSIVGDFVGVVRGRTLELSLGVSGDSPLANRPPFANAGPDQEVVATDCFAELPFDGTLSSDPDDNIRFMAWYDGDTQLGVGTQGTFLVTNPGLQLVRLEVEDTFGAVDSDEILFNVTFPEGCGQ
jgi:hypothetical protein